MALIADDKLERSLEDLREMESVKIDIDPEKEEMVPRPDPGEEMTAEADEILENADPLFQQYLDQETSDIVSALTGVTTEPDTEIQPVENGSEDGGTDQTEADDEDIDFSEFVPAAGVEAEDT
jgi:flagellar protein FlaI